MERKPPRLRLRLLLGQTAILGPGKADLLAAIIATGSISAAGRSMGMSYKKAWGLIDELNHEYRGPLVEASRGGAGKGGAMLTALGEEVLARYRAVEAAAARAVAGELAALNDLVAY